MIKTATALFATAAAILATPVLAQQVDEIVQSKGETKLAKMLEGRVAGEPENCIRTFPSRSLTIIDGTAIVSKQGRTIYVNRTQNPQSLDDDDGLLIRKFGNALQLCRLDMVTTFDRNVQFYTGNVFLTDFIPYTLPDRDEG